MSYKREKDIPRVYGLALEAADKVHATKESLPSAVVLNPGEPTEFSVTKGSEPLLPRILQWAQAAKAHVDSELAERELAVVRGPLQRPGEPGSGFRGIGPRPSPGAPHGGVQTVAVLQRETLPGRGGKKEVSVDLRYAVRARTGNASQDSDPSPATWYSALVEEKFSFKVEHAEKSARTDRDLKLRPAARDGKFDLPGKPTARAAAVGILAISGEAWTFELTPRRDLDARYYPDLGGLKRDVRRHPFPARVRRLFPGTAQGKPAVRGPATKPAVRKAAPKRGVRKRTGVQKPFDKVAYMKKYNARKDVKAKKKKHDAKKDVKKRKKGHDAKKEVKKRKKEHNAKQVVKKRKKGHNANQEVKESKQAWEDANRERRRVLRGRPKAKHLAKQRMARWKEKQVK